VAKSQLEERFALQVQVRNLPTPTREYRFDPKRRWRFDFAWPDYMVAVEIQGGTWSGGAHGRGSGIQRNYQKYNAAAIAGWWVLQGDRAMIANCELVTDLVAAITSTIPWELAHGRT
jgi:hypothetical protein